MNENIIVTGIVEWTVAILVLLGTLIMLFSSLGIIRLPDVYTRAHATTKSSTLGLLCILAGAFLHFLYAHEIVSIRLLLGIIFVFMTAPVAGHLIIRSAHRSGVPLADINVQDALAEDLELAKRMEQVQLEQREAAVQAQEQEEAQLHTQRQEEAQLDTQSQPSNEASSKK